MKILFICTGNTCRSCMAEGIFKAAIESDKQLKGKFIVASAGTAALDGDVPSENSVKALNELGIDIASHRAKMISGQAINESDLMLTMTRSHKRNILSVYPELKNKVFTLKEFAMNYDTSSSDSEYNFALDISDPYGMPLEVYKRCAREIKDAVDKVLERLKK